MLSARLEWLVHCCGRPNEGTSELQVADIGETSQLSWSPRCSRSGELSNIGITPRQQELRDALELPQLHNYPVPPGLGEDEPEEAKQQKLLKTFQDFVLEISVGMYLTQLTSNRDYCEIHCQLMEDLQTLKLDQSNGRIIEFPLTSVSKVYRIVKNHEKLFNASQDGEPKPQPDEHIVVVEFMRRKLAFVFDEMLASQRFLTCMELLIRRAQQNFGRALKSLVPSCQPVTSGGRQCAKSSIFATGRPEAESQLTLAGGMQCN